jgi:hypothetical protein
MFWTFKLNFDADILSFVGFLATVLATFFKKWACLFSIFWSH